MYNVLTMSNKHKNTKALLTTGLSKTATVSSKGQVVIPKAIRNELNIRAQDQLTFRISQDKIEVYPQPSLDEMQGKFEHKQQRPVSIKQMKKIIKEAVLKKYGSAADGKGRS
jgi:AbrB family looped-hinge helix DNA binding protein